MSLIRRLVPLAAGSIGALAVAACGMVGGPEVASTTTVPPVPAIDNPKDLRDAKVCRLLTPKQRGRFGLTSGEPGRNDLGRQCAWRGPGSVEVALTLFTDGGGLGALAGDTPGAARVRLEGYPALETFTEQGVYCRYDVGLAKDQALVAAMTGGEPDSCTALQSILTAVIDNLPPSKSAGSR